MSEWTDAERSAITSLWGKIDVGEIGQQALTGEHLIMYPWTQRHFASFGNLHMDNIKNTYTKLSAMHSEKLHVDPDNFRALAECITVCITAKFGPQVFTVGAQEAWLKFLPWWSPLWADSATSLLRGTYTRKLTRKLLFAKCLPQSTANSK
uniref:Ba1 globin, like n=1 Tax=Oryzias sinensis TaxID=183150 RepID=A0A8C7Z8V6_9TELE